MEGERARVGVSRALIDLKLPLFTALVESGFEPVEMPTVETPAWVTRADTIIELGAGPRPVPEAWEAWLPGLRVAALAMRRRALHAPGFRNRHGGAIRLRLSLRADRHGGVRYRLPPTGWGRCLDEIDTRRDAAIGGIDLRWSREGWVRSPR